ncbi:hypothetical protein QMTAC487_32240 [Sphaerotilus sp. FB-3]|nr:hypothetical protein QMTAC487_32240 [Sphaerotilus sp. FB-3]
MIGLATDDAAQRDQRVMLVGLGQRLQRHRHLQRAGHADVADVARLDAQALQLGDAALREPVGQLGVEAGLDDGDAQVAAVQTGGLALVGTLHGDDSVVSVGVLACWRFGAQAWGSEGRKPVTSRP